MTPGDITCAQCGWRNEASARMCGGCGQPLRSPTGTQATIAVPAGWGTGPEPGATTPVEAHTGYTSAMVPPAANVYTPPALGGPSPGYQDTPSLWPGATPAGQRGGMKPPAKRNPRRALLTVFVVLCVLLAAIFGAWALVVRPAIHNTVDSQLRSALDGAIEQATPANATIPPGYRLTITIPASLLNADIQNELGNVPVQNVQVHFRGNGYVLAGYTFLGRNGTIVTQLVPLANGRVQAENTTITGLLKLVENDDEMTAAFNEALGRLPPQYHVTQIAAANDTLAIIVTGQ